MTHQERLKIAQKLAREILQKYENSVVAVVVYGSTAKGEDGEHSDLEILVVTTNDLPIEDELFFYEAVLVDLYRCPEKEALAEARRVTPYWPVEADALRSYLVLYERGDFISRLKQATAELKDEDFEAAIRKLMLRTFERVGKLKNAWERDDLYGILAHGRQITYSAAMLIGLVNRQYYPSLRGMYPFSKQMAHKPEDYDQLVDVAGGFTTADKKRIYQAALKLWDNMQRFVDGQGICWIEDEVGRDRIGKAEVTRNG